MRKKKLVKFRYTPQNKDKTVLIPTDDEITACKQLIRRKVAVIQIVSSVKILIKKCYSKFFPI